MCFRTISHTRKDDSQPAIRLLWFDELTAPGPRLLLSFLSCSVEGRSDRTVTDGSGQVRELRLSVGEPLTQNFVDYLRITLAAHRSHHLADEIAEQLVSSRAIFGDFARFCANYFVACCRDRGFV